jgi:glycosyltransferase involved in cell wall biosynthesis
VRIAMLSWSDRSAFGGRSLQVRDIANELRRRGHDVEIHDGRRPSWRMSRYLARADIVHTHGGATPLLARLLTAGTSVPVLCTLHGWIRGGIRARIERRIETWGMHGCFAITAPNRSMISELPVALRRRAHHVPNGVPEQPRNTAMTDRRILWLGSVTAAKGIDVALEAFRSAREGIPALHLVVAGEPALDPALTGTGITSRGAVTDPWRECRASILLHTPQYDACPRSVLEAMREGAAIVATAVGGIPELVEHGRSALLAPYGDAAALAGHLRVLAEDPALRGRLAREARADFRANHTIATMVDRICEIYAETAGQRGPG